MRNHIISKSDILLDSQGNLKEAGYSFSPVTIYNRNAIQKSRLKVKEWDYFLVMNEQSAAAFTISDLGYLLMASVTFIDFEKELEVTRSKICLPSKDFILPVTSAAGKVDFYTKDLRIEYEAKNKVRHLLVRFDDFYKHSPLIADLWFEENGPDSMNIATPFEKDGQFYYNRKINCMKTSGYVSFHYQRHEYNPKSDAAVLDWGRGVWPYRSTWYWGTGSGFVDGHSFGFNLGYGFGNTGAATENAVYVDGKGYKLDDVRFHIPANPMQPWNISSSNGCFEGIFTPLIERSADTNLGIIRSDQHQYFGKFSGRVFLDNDKVMEVHDFPCALEKVYNRY